MTKNSYMDNYGGSVIMTILIAIGVIIVIGRLQYSNIVEPIKEIEQMKDVNLTLYHFVIIMNLKDKSSIIDNFTECTTGILSNIIQHFLQPVYTITDFLINSINEISDSVV